MRENTVCLLKTRKQLKREGIVITQSHPEDEQIELLKNELFKQEDL